MCIMPYQKRKNYRRKRYKEESKKKYFPPLERCPFVVGSTEYHQWKAERYPKGIGRPSSPSYRIH